MKRLKKGVFPLLIQLLCASAMFAQSSNSNLLGQVQISCGGVSNNNLNVNLNQIITLRVGTKKVINNGAVNEAIHTPPSIQLYPNPVNDIMFVQNDIQGLDNYSIDVYDLTGRLLIVALNKGEKITRVSVSALSPGTYIANIYDINNQIIKNFKFIKL